MTAEMEWEDLTPIVKTVPWAKAWVTVNKDGKPRLNITLSEPTMKDCGNPTKATVQVATKDGKTMIRLVFGKTGKFDIKPMELGGGRIHAIECKPPVPDGAREPEACEVEVKTAEHAIFILPLDAWEKQLNKPLPLKPRDPPVAPSATVKVGESKLGGNGAAHTSTRKVNAVQYLTNRRIKCQRLAGDFWMLNGVRVTSAAVLIEVNKHRKAAELEPLTLEQIE